MKNREAPDGSFRTIKLGFRWTRHEQRVQTCVREEMEAQVRALLLLLVLTPSTAEEKNLTGTVGGSITLPEPVLEMGFIIYGTNIVAMVNDGKMKIVEKMYENKLLWSDRTGCFTITDLQRNDSGIYTVDRKGSGVTAYKLSVFDSVSAPTVNRLGSDSCVLLCEVVNAEETTLLWYKDDEVVNQNSSAPSLSLTVHEQDYKSSYRCVAANPAEHKAEPVNLEETCGPTYTGRNQEKREDRSRVIGFVVSILSVVVIAIVGIMIKKRYHNQTPTAAQGPENLETDVQYTDVHFYDDTCGQQRENVPEPSGNHDCTQLEAVYDKLEVHRLVQHSDRG